MRLTLGDTTYDLATRAVVVGLLAPADAGGNEAGEAGAAGPAGEAAKALIALGADVVKVAGAGYPGVVVARARGPLDLEARREAVVRRAREAEVAGTPPERIVIDPGLDEAPELLAQARRFAELGYPVLVRASGAAEVALAITGGCRVVETWDIKTARRVCDVLAAILEASP